MPPITTTVSGPSAGHYTDGLAHTPGAPTWVGNASTQISIALDQNDNGATVTYRIKVEENGSEIGYVQADGTVAATDTVWRTYAQWTSVIAVTGLAPGTAPLPYRFAAQAKSSAGVVTAFSAWSEIMLPWVDLAYGPLSNAVSYECTTGDCKVSGLTVTALGDAYPGMYTIAYTLTRLHDVSTLNNVKIYFGGQTTLSAAATAGVSTITVTSASGFANGATITIALDSGTTQTTTINGAPSGTTITLTAVLAGNAASGNAVTAYTEMTGTKYTYGDTSTQFDITVSSPAYSTTYTWDTGGTTPSLHSTLRTGMILTINSSTFNAANNGSFRVIAYDDVAGTYVTVENSAGVAETNKIQSAAMFSYEAIGGAITSLTASAAGTANTNKWASCRTLGNSYAALVYIKVVPYDTTTAGDAGAAATATVSVDNRPKSITLAEFSAFTWDSDTTPEFVAPMGSIVCGSYLYFVCRIYDSTGLEVQTNNSAERTAGWYYEQSLGAGSAVRHEESGWDTGWQPMTYLGVSANYVYPASPTGNRVRYIMQQSLTQGATYTARLQQAETRSENVS